MPKNIQSIERAAAILRLLSGRTRRLGVVDLAGELGLPKGTVHGLLRTLLEVAYTAEFGLEPEESNALNLILLISTDPKAAVAQGISIRLCCLRSRMRCGSGRSKYSIKRKEDLDIFST